MVKSAICQDKKHKYCRGWFRKIESSGHTGMDGSDMMRFTEKVTCDCVCHKRENDEYIS